MSSLNQNEKETDIILIPRFNCIWNGKSRESNHIIDINTYLLYFYYVETTNGLIDNKYSLQNYFLNPSQYSATLDCESELYIQLAVSPLARGIKLQEDLYIKEGEDGPIDCFSIKKLAKDDQKRLLEYIEKNICIADERGDKILVFPEMLGTSEMKESIQKSIREIAPRSLFFLVFPSVWEKNENGRHRNTSYILDGSGEEWFGQDKLRRFIWNKGNKRYIEDIIEGDTIHLIHCEGYGSIAVAICRSELEEDIKEILIRKLNVKLILCPSWTQGHMEFERSFLNGAERNCNVAWCNACSALDKDDIKKEVFDSKKVGIITNFSKNNKYNGMEIESCIFPTKPCKCACNLGCSYSNRIYGTDYSESEEVE